MPQGKLKAKVQLPKGVKQKQKSQQKNILRKGHMTIAPKKAKLMEATKVKKGLEKQLKAAIEDHAVSRASRGEHKSLSILKSSTASPSQSQSSGKPSKKK